MDGAPAATSIESPSQPATHGLPMPRATTAACDVMPPCAVSTPCAWSRPWMSSGVVSQRTRMTASPALPSSSARSASKTTLPEAAPGEAFSPVATTSTSARRVDHRVQQLVELRRVDPRHRLLARDQALGDHVDGRLQRGRGRALRRARLQQVEPVVLDGELDVLDVAVVLLEPPHRVERAARTRAAAGLHQRERLGRADARRRRPRPARRRGTRRTRRARPSTGRA